MAVPPTRVPPHRVNTAAVVGRRCLRPRCRRSSPPTHARPPPSLGSVARICGREDPAESYTTPQRATAQAGVANRQASATFCCHGTGATGGDTRVTPCRLRGSEAPGEFSFPPDADSCGLSIACHHGGVRPALSKAVRSPCWWSFHSKRVTPRCAPTKGGSLPESGRSKKKQRRRLQHCGGHWLQ